MRRRNWMIIIVIAMLLLLAGGGIIWAFCQDKTGPEITFQKDNITYREGDSLSILLEDCVAIDKRDGDVSDQVQIANIDIIENQTKMRVTYIVYDTKNNATVVDRIVNYEGGTMAGNDPVLPSDENPSNSEEESSKEESSSSGSEESDDMYNDRKTIEQEQAIAALSPDAPILRLSVHRVRIQAGDSFDPYDYVSEAKSGSDSQVYLSEVGNYDTSAPGTYSIYICVTDEEDRISNQEVLQLIVE